MTNREFDYMILRGYLIVVAIVLVLAILLAGCSRRPVSAAPIRRGLGWVAVEEKPGYFLLAVTGASAQADAMTWLCPKGVICVIDPVGDLLTVERVGK